MKILSLALILTFITSFSIAQDTNLINLKVKGTESQELSDYYNFEGINYFRLTLSGEDLKGKYYLITSHIYWEGKLAAIDTVMNSGKHGLKNASDSIYIRVMSKKVNKDSVKFRFYLPRVSVVKEYRTTMKNSYDLRDISQSGEQEFSRSEPIDFLVYSLPYEDPNMPGYLYYCELSKDGVPPAEWGNKFGVKHNIVFRFQIIE